MGSPMALYYNPVVTCRRLYRLAEDELSAGYRQRLAAGTLNGHLAGPSAGPEYRHPAAEARAVVTLGIRPSTSPRKSPPVPWWSSSNVKWWSVWATIPICSAQCYGHANVKVLLPGVVHFALAEN